jgi:hypothetical protein
VGPALDRCLNPAFLPGMVVPRGAGQGGMRGLRSRREKLWQMKAADVPLGAKMNGDSVILAFTGVVVVLLALIAWRWLWIYRERRRLLRRRVSVDTGGNESGENDDSAQLLTGKRMPKDEGTQLFSGRIIRQLRARVTGGSVRVQWEFYPEFIHRGFVLTGQCRRNDGRFEPLVFEGHEDSGSWNECMNLGDSRTYFFTVKKKYYLFFGLFDEPCDEKLFDQISFSVRKGKFAKEMKEIMNDNSELIVASTRYAKLESQLRHALVGGASGEAGASKNPVVAKLEARYTKKSTVADWVTKKKAEIRANKGNWSDERIQEEIDMLERLAEEAELEEST